MSEYHHGMISMLFGPTAVLSGDCGGELRVVVSGVVVGRGRSLRAAIAAAQAALSAVVRFRAVA